MTGLVVLIMYSAKISTHTLTWSVTGLVVLIMYSAKISTHTLTWSVTETVPDVDTICTDFNSHAHVERDFLC